MGTLPRDGNGVWKPREWEPLRTHTAPRRGIIFTVSAEIISDSLEGSLNGRVRFRSWWQLPGWTAAAQRRGRGRRAQLTGQAEGQPGLSLMGSLTKLSDLCLSHRRRDTDNSTDKLGVCYTNTPENFIFTWQPAYYIYMNICCRFTKIFKTDGHEERASN